MKTLEETIDVVNAHGFFINNLFQIGDLWRCNLRDGPDGGFFDFTNGSSAADALGKALIVADLEATRRKTKNPLEPTVPIRSVEDFF